MANKDQQNKPIISPDNEAPLQEDDDFGVHETLVDRLKIIH
jgi:hypothetical protein